MLPLSDQSIPGQPRRSRSELDLCDSLIVSKYRSVIGTKFDGENEGGRSTETPTLHVQEPTEVSSSEECSTKQSENANAHHLASTADVGLHLHKMDISQQLRSMSQLSDVAEDEALLAPNHVLNFHRKEISDLGVSSHSSRHARQKSSSGMDSSSLPLAWGRVRSPYRAASSIYSRPASAGANSTETGTRSPDLEPREMQQDLNTLFADWPLKPLKPAEGHIIVSRVFSGKSSGSERNKPLPPTPEEPQKDSGTASFVTANNDEGSSVRFLSPLRRPSSIPSKDSSSIMSKASKASRFMERFSPPKKAVRKRRSIFRFLRPGSRKQQVRSVSSPALQYALPKTAASYDGPSDDPALLTVQYELVEQPVHTTRSASMSRLSASEAPNLEGPFAAHHALRRQPTLADYERGLSVAGDDRRRPSAVNIQRIQEIHDDDRRESEGVRRKISRARPLKDDASPLMAQALEKHQQEKALFRSASKQRESLKEAHPMPAFRPPPFTSEELNPRPGTSADHSDLLDPLEKGYLVGLAGRNSGSSHLQIPSVQAGPSSQLGSASASSGPVPSDKSSAEPVLAVHPPQNKRIETALDSWSRYPSHTRSERCSSAGRPDAVVSRDFAVDVNHEDIHASDDNEVDSPQSKRTVKSSGKDSLPEGQSKTLNSILRYYSNLFHSSATFQGQNRRTSVATGGRLEHPDLEMLPPQLAAESSHHHTNAEHLKRLKEHVLEDAERLRELVSEEEQAVGDYVKKEEVKFEGFVRKEEDKLKHYIEAEEDKIWHRQDRRSGAHAGSRSSSPFRSGSIFVADPHHKQGQKQRADTMIAPNDDDSEDPISGSIKDAGLTLDGANTRLPDDKHRSLSKAELWSDVYRSCLTRPPSSHARDSHDTVISGTKDDSKLNTMPPPPLKPAKPRSPEHSQPLDPKATIRRFPSVTVVDDCKGHFRSVSLISVKTSKSMAFERSSTHDLLELIEARERAEREKLLKPAEMHKTIDLANIC